MRAWATGIRYDEISARMTHNSLPRIGSRPMSAGTWDLTRRQRLNNDAHVRFADGGFSRPSTASSERGVPLYSGRKHTCYSLSFWIRRVDVTAPVGQRSIVSSVFRFLSVCLPVCLFRGIHHSQDSDDISKRRLMPISPTFTMSQCPFL